MIKYLVWGSVFSDTSMIIYGICNWFRNKNPWDVYLDSYDNAFVRYSTVALHSFIVLVPLCLALLHWQKPLTMTAQKIKVFFIGAVFFHLLIDFFTHQNYAHQHFWPWSDYKFYSFISLENKYFFRADSAFSAIAIVILIFWSVKKLGTKISSA